MAMCNSEFVIIVTVKMHFIKPFLISDSDSDFARQRVAAAAAICHKSWGGESPGHLEISPSFNPPFFPSLSWIYQGVWAESAHPLPNILMQFIQSNSLIKSTFIFNECMQSSAVVGRNDTMDYKPCIAAPAQQQKWGSVHILTPLPESEGVRTPGPHRIADIECCNCNIIDDLSTFQRNYVLKIKYHNWSDDGM